jgi:hypothetical protein
MARSKDVYTVLGKLCIDEEYRGAFFEQPVTKARELIGSLTTDEIDQITALAGYTKPPAERTAFIAMAKSAMHGVYAAYNCPVRPCPSPDDADPTPRA